MIIIHLYIEGRGGELACAVGRLKKMSVGARYSDVCAREQVKHIISDFVRICCDYGHAGFLSTHDSGSDVQVVRT